MGSHICQTDWNFIFPTRFSLSTKIVKKVKYCEAESNQGKFPTSYTNLRFKLSLDVYTCM